MKRSKRRDNLFFSALSSSALVGSAAKAAGYSRTAIYLYRKNDEEFAARWEESINGHIETLEAECDRRARDGVIEPVYYKGEVCGEIRKFSDTLLMFRLKKLNPEYRDSYQQPPQGTDKDELLKKISELLPD